MDLKTLYPKFTTALHWNGFLIVATRINKIVLSCILFSKTTWSDFSAWANCYSLIFILLLWLDFGFSRSIPRFSVLFIESYKIKNNFLIFILGFKFFISLLAAFFFIVFRTFILSSLKLSSYELLFYLALLLFIAETIKSALQCIYHSYFWNKDFNSLETVTLFTGTSLISIATLTMPLSSRGLIHLSVVLQIITTFILVIIALIKLPRLFRSLPLPAIEHQEKESLPALALYKNFITHSASMWALILLQSITERNALIPFITMIGGHKEASIFKIANDGALFFYRCIIKTFGVSTTAFLSNIEESSGSRKDQEFIDGLMFITKKSITFITPIIITITLLPIIKPLVLSRIFFWSNNDANNILSLFVVLTSLYLLQALFLAYDQCLEVKKNYRILFISALPYLAILFYYKALMLHETPWSLFTFLGVIHGMRILSLGTRVAYTTIFYSMHFPLNYLIKIIIATSSMIIPLLCFLTYYIS